MSIQGAIVTSDVTPAAEEATMGGLIDLSGIPLEKLWELNDQDTVLNHTLRRVLEGTLKDQVSAFNSAM
jgi:FXSXX-COOH protein